MDRLKIRLRVLHGSKVCKRTVSKFNYLRSYWSQALRLCWSQAGQQLASSIKMGPQDSERSLDELVPQDILIMILSRLSDARDLGNCATVNKVFRCSCTKVTMMQFLCKCNFRVTAELSKLKDKVTAALRPQLSSNLECLSLKYDNEMSLEDVMKTYFSVFSNFSFIEKSFILKWLRPPMSTKLQNLTVINPLPEYLKFSANATPFLQLLSTHCKQLRTLELGFMYLDTRDLEKMTQITKLTLRFVRLMATGLRDINESMPELDIVELISIVGLEEAHFTSNKLNELNMYLMTRAKSVILHASHAIKLRLRMVCPETCVVDMRNVQCLAISMKNYDNSMHVQFENITFLKELEISSSQFSVLASLSSSNPSLQNLVLDLTSSKFAADPVRDESLPDIIGDIDHVRNCCPNLQMLTVGPNLWSGLGAEQVKLGIKGDSLFLNWPRARHIRVPVFQGWRNETVCLLEAVVKAIPTLTCIELYVPSNSYGDQNLEIDESFFLSLKLQFPELEIKCGHIEGGNSNFFIFPKSLLLHAESRYGFH